MPRAQTPAPLPTPDLESSLYALNVDGLKWYAAALAGKTPTRKGELVTMLARTLTNPAEVRQIWERLAPAQQQVVAEVVHHHGGRYDEEIVKAKYPGVAAPKSPQSSYYGYLGRRDAGDRQAKAFDLFFYSAPEGGRLIPADLAALLRALAPAPPPAQMRSHDEPPAAPAIAGDPAPPEVMVTEAERAVFHDLAATLHLVQQGKASVSAATRHPTLATLRHLRQRLLVGDYFGEQDYERAEDAIRPFALIMLVQAAKWAAPAGGSKLELTRAGQALIAGPPQAQHIREAWKLWLTSDLLDELSRIRALRGQQSKGTRLTKPAERRKKLDAVLRACPIGRWVEIDELFRFMRAEGQSPAIERNTTTALYIGSYPEYGWLGYNHIDYWDVVIGSYLRAVLWEYAATLGLIEIAYTWPEVMLDRYTDLYGIDEYEYLSRYDGLLGLRVTNLGAYVFGLADEYSAPAPAAEDERPLLKVLPNLDVVITDASRVMPTDRAFVERIGALQSEDVYRLNRDQLIEAAQHGLSLQQIKEFLAGKSGLPESDFPQTVRVFFADMERRMGALREAGVVLVLEGDDPYLLTELANSSSLRTLVRLGTIGEQTVLLVPEEQEAAVRRQLKKLGYVPRKT